MSAIALKWVSGITVGNQTAKQVLLFLASHSFPGSESWFRNETMCEQLEISERGLRNAYAILLDKKLIKKTVRFNPNGSQRTNGFRLNIPQEFLEKWFTKEQNDGNDGRKLVRGGGGTTCLPNNNKNLLNSSNSFKNSCASDLD